MTGTASQDLAVKRTAVKLLSTACDGLLAEDAPLTAALVAALRSPNDPLFIYNYRAAEAEFSRLPRETTDALISRCKSRIAESQEDILAEIRSLKVETEAPTPAARKPAMKPAPRKAPPQRKTTAVEWT